MKALENCQSSSRTLLHTQQIQQQLTKCEFQNNLVDYSFRAQEMLLETLCLGGLNQSQMRHAFNVLPKEC